MSFTFIILLLLGSASNLTPAAAQTPFLQCIYNDFLYTDGQTIEVFRGACSKLVCRVLPSSFGTGFTSRIYLENLDRCQCSIITPRIPFPLVTLNKVIGAAENLVDKTVSNFVSHFYIGRNQGCYFNNTFVELNEFVEHLPSKCVLLQCNMDGGRPVIELFVKSICFCRGTPDPTTTVTITASPTVTVTTTASPWPTSTTASPWTTATTSTWSLPTFTVTVTATASPLPTTTVTITASPPSTTSTFPSSTITVTVTASPTSMITITVTVTPTTATSTATTATSTATATTDTSTATATTDTSTATATTDTSTATATTDTSTATATTATTSGLSISRRAGLVAVEEDDDDDDDNDDGGCDAYARVSARHSMCLPPNQRCSVLASGVPAAAKRVIVAAHNSYRAKVARGSESRGLNGPQPAAANLYRLSWNEELASIAQAWAFQCQLLSDCYECRAPITRPYSFTGQNVHQLLAVSSRHGNADRMNPVKEWGIVIDSWYSEVAYVDENIVRSYTPVSQNRTIGHYTQMLWSSTYEIGCGQVTFGPCVEFVNNAPSLRERCQIFVCNYGPAGNLITHPIYSIGLAASQCLHGPSQQFSELCRPKPTLD